MEPGQPSPWERWSAVSERDQREVGRLAKRGQRHPNSEVAAAAESWARVVLDAHAADKPETRFGGILLSIVEFSPLMDFGLVDLDDRMERRWARRVLAAR